MEAEVRSNHILSRCRYSSSKVVKMCKLSSNGAVKPKDDDVKGKGKTVQGVNDFHWSAVPEPHATRRKVILARYPEIKELYGHDPNMRYVCLLLVSIQVGMAYSLSRASSPVPWWLFVGAAYLIGGTSNHMLLLAMHELSHNLGFARMHHNRLFSFFCNLPIGIPAAISFKRYHLEHHKYQGEVQVDMDLPTQQEANIFRNTATKLFFVMFQILFYAVRPLLVNPKKPGPWEAVNAVCCVAFDVAVVLILGPKALFYLLLSTLLGTGLHPCAAHFIAEHFVFVAGTETYSYYGWLNIFAFNVGYHNEHHDFPAVCGSRLPQVRKIASEFYDAIPQHKSWCKVHWDFIMDPNITAFSRVKRDLLTTADVAAIKTR
jgi:sphingolipid 4-desaturase/C4-monooxygenase